MDKKNLIVASTPYERLVHWGLALSCIALFVTGVSIMFQSFGGVANLTGGKLVTKYIHNVIGFVYFAATIAAYKLWAHEAKMEDYDREWLQKGGGYLVKRDDIPPMGRLNGGQKIFFWMMAALGVAMFVTGLVMWFPLAMPHWLVRFFYLIHAIGACIWGGAIVMHGYLGSFANPGSLQVMTTGYVTKGWAKLQHGRWYQELKDQGKL